MENWDLQAVVRGCSNNDLEGFAYNTMEFSQSSCFGFAPVTIEEDDEIFRAFPQLFDATTALDELEELYKPFYPIVQPISPIPIIPTPPTLLVQQDVTGQEKEEPKLKSVKESSPMCRRRKTQNKRVVKEVKEQDLFSDVWAWRKYGQKPIKGSPYPRSYYRCSSSKGCSARKQVERSNSNPELFIITFTAEHNHDRPTRRNSLAGSTRTKFPKSQNKEKNKHELVPVKEEAQRLPEEYEVSQESARDVMFVDQVVSRKHTCEGLDKELEELSQLMPEPIMADGFFSDQFSDSYFESFWLFGHCSSTVTGAC
ncbi:probable WRKY transcription factor 29 isoform X2 [Argentina anserina]|uniref:probable WRKY transcription factor 29 isoform X2 n=1 Tax=Argentina anserina TaxID=57926 RepID=UPI00217638DA|nr:probable WRKY transcription factor 29 isoform X2 [Potentilla anserina]